MSAPVASETRRAVEGEQADQGVLSRCAEPGCDQERADLVAVQSDGVGLVGDTGATDVHGGRVIEEVFLDGIPVEPGDRGQPPRHRRPRPAPGFQTAGERLDVSPPCREQ